MPRVTVIIPTFNRARYLEESLVSAATQDFADLVVVVADNASDDETPDIVEGAIRKFGANRVSYVRRPTNIGWNANFNRSLADVATEFALVLGDDDRLLPGMLTRAVDALARSPTAGFVHSAFETIDEAGEHVDTATDWTKGLTSDTLEPGQVFIKRTIPWPTRVFTHGALIRHAAFVDPMWDPEDGLVADYPLWLRLALEWDVQYLTAPGVQRRVHRGSLSTGLGTVASADYLIEPEATLALRRVKLRFIDRFAGRLDDPAGLRRAVYEGSRRELAAYSRALAGVSRRDGARALRRAFRAQPSVVVQPWTWRAGAKVLVGPRLSARLGRG